MNTNNPVLKPINIFISYAREDWNIAKRLYVDFNALGLKPWMDTEDLLPGQNWEEEIYDAIRNSTFFIALLSSRSLSKRGYVQKELKIALDYLDEFPSSNIFLIPVLLEDCKPANKRLNQLHWIRLDESYDAALHKLVRVMKPDEYENLISRIQDVLAEHKRTPSPTPLQRIIFRLWDRPNMLGSLLQIFYENNIGLLSVTATAEPSGMAEVKCEIATKVSDDFVKLLYPIDGLVTVFVLDQQVKKVAAQHSVHPTGGSLRVFRHFTWLEVRSVKMALSRPAHQRVTHTVGRREKYCEFV